MRLLAFVLFSFFRFFTSSAQDFQHTVYTDVFIAEMPQLLPEQAVKYEQNLQKSIGSDFDYASSSFLKRIDDKDAKKLYKQFSKSKNFKGNAAIFWKPHHLVYFVNQGEIVYIVLLCLECNKTISYPNLNQTSDKGLTTSFHLYLRTLLNKYKFTIP